MSWFAHLTASERAGKFHRAVPEEFRSAIDRSRIPDLTAFDLVANWDGTYPGPIGFGPTGTAKTRAVWAALKRLCIADAKTFTWQTAKQLTERYFKHHMDGEPERFWEYLNRTELIFIDDIDKLELNDRNCGVLFEFYDVTYRDHRPVVATTNKNRAWWTERLGEAHTRRMFDEAHQAVEFIGYARKPHEQHPASF